MLLCRKPKIFDVDAAGVILCLALLGGTWGFWVRPLADKASAVEARQEQLRREKAELIQELAQLRLVAGERENLARLLQATPDVLRGNTSMSEVLFKLGELARTHELRMDEVNLGEEAQAEHFRRARLALRLGGDCRHIGRFLDALAASMPFTRVAQLCLEGKGPQTGWCETRLDLDIFTP